MSKLHRRLADVFGPERIYIRNPVHTQILIADSKLRHDVWCKRNGGLTWRIAGSAKVESGHPNNLIHAVNTYVDLSRYSQFNGIVDRISRGIEIASSQATQSRVVRGVYCDAGWKAGHARISVIAVLGNRVEAWSDHVDAANVNEAEFIAICHAMEAYPHDIIYSDSRSAVRAVGLERVVWIPREQNGGADRVANFRRID